MKNNSRVNYISIYKIVFNSAVKSGLIDKTPFNFYNRSLRRKKASIQT
ncbi:hypothetical protein [Flavobacterium palustre]